MLGIFCYLLSFEESLKSIWQKILRIQLIPDFFFCHTFESCKYFLEMETYAFSDIFSDQSVAFVSTTNTVLTSVLVFFINDTPG